VKQHYINEAQMVTNLRNSSHRVPEPENLRELGLTCRESGVMHWLIQGKRNGEIATILGNRAKTITKHLERIFDKLGVETRTAAALVALEKTRTVFSESASTIPSKIKSEVVH
jgi:DNA-binding NarL/FixJ family response regulator